MELWIAGWTAALRCAFCAENVPALGVSGFATGLMGGYAAPKPRTARRGRLGGTSSMPHFSLRASFSTRAGSLFFLAKVGFIAG
jgi:hypothetical protein